MTARILSLAEAHDLVAGALMRSDTSPENAASVARALVAAEAMGQSGHGLRRVAAYCAQAGAGKVDGHAAPRLAAPMPAALASFAYPALDLAVEALPAVAGRMGLAAAGISRSHHCGVAGLVVERLADQGLVALMFANAPAAIAPWGGRTPLFGTNPIAFAAPIEGDTPLVVDLSLSRVTRGRIMAAKQKGEPIPEDWAFDRDGRPTTDAAAALKGAMAPLGDAKGATLALMVEVLAAGLTGANFAPEATSFFDVDGPPPGVGQLVIAFSPAAFGDRDARERVAGFAARVAAEPGARLPGRRRQRLAEAARENGLALKAALVEEIAAIGRM